MLDLKIDKEKCIKCGLCAQDCPVLIIDGKTEYPEIKEGKESNCLKCQHCLAICPTGALSILGKNPEESIPVREEYLVPEQLANMIKTRRSIRKYRKEELGKELILELLDITAYAPSGHNNNGVLLSVIDNRKDLESFREMVYEAIKTEFGKGNKDRHLPLLAGFQNLWESKGIDIMFRGAPHLIIASAPKHKETPFEDCIISLSYFEMVANSRRVGTLWNGMLKWIINDIAPELRTKLGIPEDHVFGTTINFGYAARKYARSIQSEGLNLNRVKFE